MERARIAVAGASGLIGSALVASLRADGHQVVRLVRRPARTPDEVPWDPENQQVDAAGLAGCDAVVNLAGAGVGDHRWTEAYKKRIRDSRVFGTAALAEALAGLDTPPRVFVSGSAIGIYGDTGDRVVDEDSPPGDGFLARVCVEWEEAAAPAQEAGVRTVFARTGLVVSRQGGAWGRMFPLFRAGLGGRLGDGRQYWSFISLHDEVAALRHLLDTESLSGPVNLTVPEPLTNARITAAMGRVLRRPTPFAVPAPVLRAVLGEMAQDVLGSARVVPRRLLESGFSFAFPGIEDAVRAAL
ncbi:epimerase [Streptomyces thermoviolaceus subsp. thermoviolaceus]|uniref:TIGR01777 family protein n=1 Tax=Streptomyces thermoviolaceus subsp. thermoviolaceus TaxID=66860 RepID=A0ABX0YN04_STRTL|nr:MULTISPECIES: TIGR01777 family oxidoreductase [Streptomyces]NJP13888.1 TIGR01777 family protein [Streptomyces thermoviolaceus subsp. thermoviolaceus]RSS08332.1 TIGR01777 family protein [Streptomyces sp. WAC00469]GHA79721.1 epimerase [Streptomyces thermoviolaceus subsp. thermoviolaceus]